MLTIIKIDKTNVAFRRQWFGHCRQTPIGMVPVLINGHIPAYQSAMGTDFAGPLILHYFPREARPTWLRREAKRWERES